MMTFVDRWFVIPNRSEIQLRSDVEVRTHALRVVWPYESAILHFALLLRGKPVDPMRFMRGAPGRPYQNAVVA